MTRLAQLKNRLYGPEEFMHCLFDSAPDAILVIDENGSITRGNARAEIMYGYDKEELAGKPLEKLVPEQYRQTLVGPDNSYFASPTFKQMEAGLILLGIKKNGEEFPVDIMLSIMRVEQGNMAIAIVRDITERKHAEEALKLVMNQREDFVATLSHDLKSPVLAANRALKLVMAGNFGATTNKQVMILDTILHSNESMYGLISTLLDVYRFDSGAKIMAIAWHDLSKTIRKQVDELSLFARSQDISITTVLPDRPVLVPCDRDEIRRVVQNLLDNSLKFTPAGGTVQVSLEQAEGMTKVIVRDTGMGVSDEVRSKLFQRYWAPAASGRKCASTGLGLYLCRKIVESHGGEIWCENPIGPGSAFCFTIRHQPCGQLAEPAPQLLIASAA